MNLIGSTQPLRYATKYAQYHAAEYKVVLAFEWSNFSSMTYACGVID